MDLKGDYKAALIALRPKGIIWEVKEDSVTDHRLDLQAEMFARVHVRTDDLFKEADKRNTKELLDKWEDVFNLPSEGSYEDRITALNRAAFARRQDIPFYLYLMEMNGSRGHIREHCPFMFGFSAFGSPDECGQYEIIYYWEVIVTAGADENIANLKKLFNLYKQSDTVLTFIDRREESGV